MSWILFLSNWIESGVGYHRRVELWVEPSVLLSAFVNRELNPFWKLIMNELNLIESTWILVNPSESWIMKEVAVHITVWNTWVNGCHTVINCLNWLISWRESKYESWLDWFWLCDLTYTGLVLLHDLTVRIFDQHEISGLYLSHSHWYNGVV